MLPCLVLFAPGAGAPSSSEWMQRWARYLGRFGSVVPFDYPYQREGRKSPDRLDRLIAAHRQALTEARKQHRGPVILAGKSMGSRVGCHVSLEEPVDALVCLGYPLRGQSGALRDEVLKQLKAPVLFVQGSKDPLCPLLELDRVRPHMVASNELYVVDGGNHSLEVGKRELSARNDTQPAVEARALTAIQAFLERTLG